MTKTSKSLRRAISSYWEIKANGFNPKLIFNHNINSFMAVYIYLPNVEGIELIEYNQ